jgi:vancomycin resistance protein YoaR
MKSKITPIAIARLATAAAIACGCLWAASRPVKQIPATEALLAGYATGLSERTPGQAHNAALAAASLNGSVIGPGGDFSFNHTVKSWTHERGYVKAPVSYEGELVKAYGGGVCQTSTTLYNAALLAGLLISERHPHVMAPHYVLAGRDAAVAQYDVDLKLHNPYPWPVRIEATSNESTLSVRIYGSGKPLETIRLETQRIATITPQHLTRVMAVKPGSEHRAYVRNPGMVGCRVLTYRIYCQNGKEVKREFLGDDTYAAMDRVVQDFEVSSLGS